MMGHMENRGFTQDLHDATSQKTAFFIVTAVKTSDLTYCLQGLQEQELEGFKVLTGVTTK
jgi:hypothetical protein